MSSTAANPSATPCNAARYTGGWALALLVLSLLGLSTGCASMRSYVAPTLLLESGDRTSAMQAAVVELRARGLRIQRIDDAAGLVVGVSAVSGTELFQTRDRWEVRTANDTVVVTLHPQMRTTGRWENVEELCDTYAYARERLLLVHLRERLAVAPSGRLATPEFAQLERP